VARLTKKEQEQIESVFYGIDPETFEVSSVSVTRGGILRRWHKSGTCHTHTIGPGRQARTEIVVLYGLTDLFEVFPQYENADNTKNKIEELKVKIAAMRAKKV
jgi:hypothetical protein